MKAKLCSRVDEYEFSTLHGLFGASHLPFPISYTLVGMDLNLPEIEQKEKWIEWLNTPFTAEAELLIQSSLRKKRIEKILCRETRVPHPLLANLL